MMVLIWRKSICFALLVKIAIKCLLDMTGMFTYGLLMTVIACTMLAKDQTSPHSSMAGESTHKAPLKLKSSKPPKSAKKESEFPLRMRTW